MKKMPTPKGARMRLEANVYRAYGVGLGMLVVGALGFRAAVAQLNLFLMKESVPLREGFDTIPTKIGHWSRVGKDARHADALIEELGTKQYLDRIYALDGDPKRGVIMLHIAYYTGTIDAVPHIPERCWAVHGLEMTREATTSAVQLNMTDWQASEGPANLATGLPYRTAIVRDPFTAELERVTMPLEDIAMRVLEFQDPANPRIRQVGGYFFLANGRTTASALGVRGIAFDLTNRYAYYCKIQLTMSGVVDGADGTMVPKFEEETSAFLGDLLPHVMKRLPDWPVWEQKSLGQPSSTQTP